MHSIVKKKKIRLIQKILKNAVLSMNFLFIKG